MIGPHNPLFLGGTEMKGLFTALLVPFDEKGNIIEQGLREIVRQNIDVQGVDGLYVNGSSGENFMLSTEQKSKSLKSLVKKIKVK